MKFLNYIALVTLFLSTTNSWSKDKVLRKFVNVTIFRDNCDDQKHEKKDFALEAYQFFTKIRNSDNDEYAKNEDYVVKLYYNNKLVTEKKIGLIETGGLLTAYNSPIKKQDNVDLKGTKLCMARIGVEVKENVNLVKLFKDDKLLAEAKVEKLK